MCVRVRACVCVYVCMCVWVSHDHEVIVVGSTAEQVWGHTREMALGEGAGEGDKPSLGIGGGQQDM